MNAPIDRPLKTTRCHSEAPQAQRNLLFADSSTALGRFT